MFGLVESDSGDLGPVVDTDDTAAVTKSNVLEGFCFGKTEVEGNCNLNSVALLGGKFFVALAEIGPFKSNFISGDIALTGYTVGIAKNAAVALPYHAILLTFIADTEAVLTHKVIVCRSFVYLPIPMLVDVIGISAVCAEVNLNCGVLPNIALGRFINGAEVIRTTTLQPLRFI